MEEDYASFRRVRLSRRWGWGLTALILAGVVSALAWRMLEVSGERARAATLESLQAGLVRLAAEHMARGERLEAQWLAANPFEQLRWQSRDYCGELAALNEAVEGCWHFWPARAWVVRRDGQGLMAWRLRGVPESGGREEVLAVELAQVPRDEIRVYLQDEEKR